MVTTKSFVTASFEEALAAVRGAPLASSFLTVPSPQELHALYSRGYRGVRRDRQTPEGRRAFGEMMAAMPTLYEAFPWAKDLGKGKLNTPYVAMLQLMPEWGGEDAQERGDCTVHGTYHAAAIDYGIDALFGETKYMGPLACENIYRSRGFSGDGWDCQSPALYISPAGSGGLLYRQVWKDPAGSESVDLSKYNSSWEGNGRAGVPDWMEKLSQPNKVKWVIPIKTAQEYRDCHAIGFGHNCCSGQGFSSETDENGVAKAQGSWSHSMAHIGSDDRDWAHQKYGDMIGLIQNNWGKWNTQSGKPPESPKMPVGSMYSKMSTAMSMVNEGDTWALCGVWGWNRTNWEAFNVTNFKSDLMTHLKSSTVQDYYMQRHERLRDYIDKVSQQGFLAI